MGKKTKTKPTSLAVDEKVKQEQQQGRTSSDDQSNKKQDIKTIQIKKERILLSLSIAHKHLSNIFSTRYYRLMGSGWIDGNKDDIKEYINLLGITTTIDDKEMVLIESADRSTWTIPLLYKLQISSTNHLIIKQPQHRDLFNLQDQLNETSNRLYLHYNHYHLLDIDIIDDQFTKDWNDIKSLLIIFGTCINDLNNIEQPSSSSINNNIINNNRLYKQLKGLMKERKYQMVVENVTKYINNIPLLGDDMLARLYAIRALADIECRRLQDKKGLGPTTLLDHTRSRSLKIGWKRSVLIQAAITHWDDKLDEAKKLYDHCLAIDIHYSKAIKARSTVLYDIHLIETDSVSLDWSPEQIGQLAKARGVACTAETLFQRPLKNVQNGYYSLHGVGGRKKSILDAYHSFSLEDNNSEALYFTGMLLQRGQGGVPRDMDRGFELIRKSTQVGKNSTVKGTTIGREAFLSLAQCYQYGFGTNINLEQARNVYMSAADGGDATALNDLGTFYQHGKLFAKNLQKALHYYTASANTGFPVAMFNLGCLYMGTEGVTRDLDKAEMWLKRSLPMMPNAEPALRAVRELRNLEKVIPKKAIEDFEKVAKMTNNNNGNPQEYLEKEKFPFDKLEELASTSKTAAWLFEAKIAYLEAMYALTTKEPDLTIIQALAKVYLMTELVADDFEAQQQFLQVVNRHLKKDSKCRDAMLCYAYIKGGDLDSIIPYLEQSLKLYPSYFKFWELLSNLYSFKGNWNKANICLRKAMELLKQEGKEIPINYYYCLGSITISLNQEKDKIAPGVMVKDMLEFLSKCEKDDRHRPAAYYQVAVCYGAEGPDRLKEYYKKGLDSEKDQLPFFLPIKSASKQVSGGLVNLFNITPEDMRSPLNTPSKPSIPVVAKEELKKQSTTATAAQKQGVVVAPSILPIHRSQSSLESLVKKTLVIACREGRQSFDEMLKQKHGYRHSFVTSSTTINIESAPDGLTNKYKEMNRNEMDPGKDLVYKNRFIKLVIVERPWKSTGGVHCICQDTEGTFAKLAFYDESLETQEIVDRTLFVGLGFTLINPYHRIPLDGRPIIRINSLKDIYTDGTKANQVCTYCLASHLPLSKCSKCKKSYYCSRDCQVKDFQNLKHKLVCDLDS